ncbi:CMGC family protein kinase [Histomonas meleagridis]|uniref:CMGC family protein kinase n=1 Tax=Histomonas meleagridis TaxID=135588 RepID=UPI003559F7D7|nr:CMGC family protein kinase [Histomonas meleagridis]KAH0799910.1 CMGC family protein kinase [Histomonas meleagridis]
MKIGSLAFFQNESSKEKIGEFEKAIVIGKGTFGTVFKAQTADGKLYAIKKVLQDPHYKNRELSILKEVNHPNCLKLIDYYVTTEGEPQQLYLHIITDCFPTDLSFYLRKEKGNISNDIIKIFSYQIFRALSYLHKIGICHRDIKPSNILINPENGKLGICDFGSAKKIQSNEPSVSYIATRNYRAPELLFDCRYYNYPVDIWAAGCIVAEFVNGGTPIFRGKSNDYMIRSMINIIGTPTESDLNEYGNSKVCPNIKRERRPIQEALSSNADPQLLDLLEHIFVYSPSKRITAEQCLNHPFFDGIRKGNLKLPNNKIFVLEPET